MAGSAKDLLMELYHKGMLDSVKEEKDGSFRVTDYYEDVNSTSQYVYFNEDGSFKEMLDEAQFEQHQKDGFQYQIENGKNGKEYVVGQMNVNGDTKDVRFAKTYGTHEFNDSEIKSLLRGEEITISLRSGDAPVKLGDGSYMGHSYFGPQRTDLPEKVRRTPDISDIQQSSPTADKQAGE